jgi:hypothetical protein
MEVNDVGITVKGNFVSCIGRECELTDTFRRDVAIKIIAFFLFYGMILKANASLKCRALWRRKMAGARRGAQPILDAGALTQARRGDRAGRMASAGETYITAQDLAQGWVRHHSKTCSLQNNFREI